MLAVHDGRLFLAAQALDSVAIGVAGVALPWLVLQSGGSQGEAGLVFAVTVAPYVLLGLVAGAVGDRLPRRAVMLAGHASQAAFAAVIPLWTIYGTPPPGVVLVLAFAVGSGRLFVDAAAFGAVASIVGTERFVDGQSAVSAAWSLGLFAGPAVGGALVGAVGPGRALAAEAAALVLAAALVATIHASFGNAEPAERGGGVREGIGFMVRNRGIATYTLVTIAWNLAGAGAFALLVPLLRDGVGLGSGAVGGILALGSLATLASSLMAAGLARRFGAAAVMSTCLLIAPLAIAGLGLAGGFGTALIAAVGYLLMQGLFAVLAIGERQRRAPERLQGRVGIAGRMVLLGTTASGSAIASGVVGAVGVGHLYLLMGAATFLVGVAAAPPLLRLEG